MSFTSDGGDNREVTLEADKSVKFSFVSGNTKAEDTDVDKYFNTSQGRTQMVLRTNQAITITHFDGLPLTDPISLSANTSFSIRGRRPIGNIRNYISLTVATTVQTNVKLFVI